MCESEPTGDGAGIDNGAEQRWVSEPEGGGGGGTQQDRDGSLSMSRQEVGQAWTLGKFRFRVPVSSVLYVTCCHYPYLTQRDEP